MLASFSMFFRRQESFFQYLGVSGSRVLDLGAFVFCTAFPASRAGFLCGTPDLFRWQRQMEVFEKACSRTEVKLLRASGVRDVGSR